MTRTQHALFLEGQPDKIERIINRALDSRNAKIVLVNFQPIKTDPLTDFSKDLKDSPNRYACIVVFEVDA